MRVSYNKLWKLLIDKEMKKSQLREAVGASKSTFAKLRATPHRKVSMIQPDMI